MDMKKRILLLLVFLFSFAFHVCSYGQAKMIEEGKRWMYHFMHNYDQIWLPAGEVFASEDWLVTESEEVNGKTYWKLWRLGAFVHVKSMWRPPYSDEDEQAVKGEVIAIREENGKVYSLKQQYLALLKALYPKEVHPNINYDDFYVPLAEDEYEILLYDFTLNEGDQYPFIGEVYVKEVSHYTTRDGLSRKVLILTNGAIIVEGIGCINSIGGVIIYQNMENIREYFDSEPGTEKMIYAQLFRCELTSTEATIYSASDDYQLITSFTSPSEKSVNSKSVNCRWSDLSGRRLNAAPTRPGLYIKDGRKVLIK